MFVPLSQASTEFHRNLEILRKLAKFRILWKTVFPKHHVQTTVKKRDMKATASSGTVWMDFHKHVAFIAKLHCLGNKKQQSRILH